MATAVRAGSSRRQVLVAAVLLWVLPSVCCDHLSQAEPLPDGTRPLVAVSRQSLPDRLPRETQLLDAAAEIDAFLAALEGAPPDWTAIHGSDGRSHDERLFALNRQRDRLRQGKPALARLVTFLWPGELSSYDRTTGGFRLALGPKLIPTAWGLVRFKPEGLPGNLIAIPNPVLREAWRRKSGGKAKVEITVAITGRLVEEESIVYDLSHEDMTAGVVLPVVRVERIEYFLIQ